MVVVASVRNCRLRTGTVFAWWLAGWMTPAWTTAAENGLLGIESGTSTWPLRQTPNSALQAILHEPAFDTPHLARMHEQVLSDQADILHTDLGGGQAVMAQKAKLYTDLHGMAIWEGENPADEVIEPGGHCGDGYLYEQAHWSKGVRPYLNVVETGSAKPWRRMGTCAP